jgi:multisubunit Na+/H+ antiporter MnhF subunit
MTAWLVAATVLAACVVPCAAVCFYADPLSGLAALEVSGALGTAILMILSEAFQRPPFIDLALIMATLTIVSGVTFARVLERHL